MKLGNELWQGDVGLRKIESLPQGLKEKDKILAYGEVTGHKHQFKTDKVKILVDAKGNQYAVVEQQSDLLHEEHDTISVPQGLFSVIRQREYDLVEGVRQVAD